MKRSAFALFSLLLVGSFPLAGLGQAAAESQLELLGTNTVSVGKIPCYEIKSVPFRLKNRSNKPVSIRRIKPTCVCVRADRDKWHLLPGEEAVVTLNIDPVEISGPFQRGAWVVTSDRGQNQIKLMVEGESIPLFKGQPTTMVNFHAPRLGVSWTNTFSMEATESGLRLGQPVFETNANLRVALTLKTNLAEKISYQASLVVTALAPGRHTAAIQLPVEGKTNMPPVIVNFLARTGLELSVVPDQLLLLPAETPVTKRLLLNTQETNAVPSELTWEPSDEGLKVQVKNASRPGNLVIDLTFTPEAIKRILAKKNPTLTFRYPNYELAVVHLLSADGEKPGLESDDSHEAQPTDTAPQLRQHARLFNHSGQKRIANTARPFTAR